MKRIHLFPFTLLLGVSVFLSFATTSCDTTPRERKEMAANEVEKLDERAEALASKTREEAKEVREALARRKAEREARRARGPVAGKQLQMETELLGEYRQLENVSAENLRDAYVHFLQQVRDRKENWTMEDWDYVSAIYKRLNEREKVLHDDIILRHATKIKALQAEFLALQNKAGLNDYQRIKKGQQ